MKKTITEDVDFCDKCNQRADWLQSCARCGIEMCHKCRDSFMVEYTHRVHSGGSGDTRYCTACDMLLCETKADPVHQAFFAVRELREENNRWYESFKKRAEAAEQRVQSLIKK